MMLLFLAIALCFTIYLLQRRNFNYWKNKNVPYVKPTIFFGNVLPLLTGKFQSSEFVQNLYNSTDAPYLGAYVFHQPYLIIKDLNMIKQILVKDFDSFINHTVSTSKYDKLGSRILILHNDHDWRVSRKNVSCLFSPNRLKNMHSIINQVTDNLIDHIEKTEEKPSNSREIFIKFGTDVVTMCFLGIEPNSLIDKNSKFYAGLAKQFKLSLVRKIQIASCFFFPQIIDILNFTFMDKTSMVFIQKTLLETLKTKEPLGKKNNETITILTELNDKYNEQDKSYMISILLSFLLAGFETIGSSLVFLFYELSCNQNIQQRLRKEILKELKHHQTFSYEAVNRMKYLDMVVSESLRKYPILGILDRRCNKTYKVPNTDLVIEKGTGIYISALAIHYDEQYFPNPNTFNPERFSPENKRLIPECAYLPFGKGLRGCIGARFSTLVTKIAVAKTILKFQIDRNEITTHPIKFDSRSLFLTPLNSELHLTFKQLNSDSDSLQIN